MAYTKDGKTCEWSDIRPGDVFYIGCDKFQAVPAALCNIFYEGGKLCRKSQVLVDNEVAKIKQSGTNTPIALRAVPA